MPSLENLRKQAKLFMRWRRTGYYPVAAQIRAILPRYRHLSDAQVLAHSFKPSDAQELVARRLGFENWQALKAGIKTMTERDIESAAKAVLIGAAPQLFVADVQASRDFFTRKLGFVTDFIYGNPPFYGQVLRDGAQLALRRVDRPVLDGIASAMKADIDMLAASITVDDVKALFLEFKAADVPFYQPLRSEPWGARTFIVRDPDGNLLLFAGSGS
jgi:catechol 2,3-dioxygenase-like lactoylglutathione lyase family enzyme